MAGSDLATATAFGAGLISGFAFISVFGFATGLTAGSAFAMVSCAPQRTRFAGARFQIMVFEKSLVPA